MTLEIRQQCDGCGNVRAIPCGQEVRRFVNVQNAVEQNGWKTVQENKHLCPHCIKEALLPKPGKPIILDRDDRVVNGPIIVNYPKET